MTSQLDRAPSGRLATPYTTRQAFVFFSEDVLLQPRSGASDFRLIADISRSCHQPAKPEDPSHCVERSQMTRRDSEGVEHCQVSRLAPLPH
jgi:hypothetical protein